MKAAPCGHLYCPTCWKGYLHEKISSGPAVLDVRCPTPKCGAAVSVGCKTCRVKPCVAPWMVSWKIGTRQVQIHTGGRQLCCSVTAWVHQLMSMARFMLSTVHACQMAQVPKEVVRCCVDPADFDKFEEFALRSFVEDNRKMAWWGNQMGFVKMNLFFSPLHTATHPRHTPTHPQPSPPHQHQQHHSMHTQPMAHVAGWVRRCVGKGCEAAVECCVDRMADEPLDVICTCGASFCFNCKEEAHRPVSGAYPVVGLFFHLPTVGPRQPQQRGGWRQDEETEGAQERSNTEAQKHRSTGSRFMIPCARAHCASRCRAMWCACGFPRTARRVRT